MNWPSMVTLHLQIGHQLSAYTDEQANDGHPTLMNMKPARKALLISLQKSMCTSLAQW